MYDFKTLQQKLYLIRELLGYPRNDKIEWEKIAVLLNVRKFYITTVTDLQTHIKKTARPDMSIAEREEARSYRIELQIYKEHLTKVEKELYDLVLWIPNIPHSSVPK